MSLETCKVNKLNHSTRGYIVDDVAKQHGSTKFTQTRLSRCTLLMKYNYSNIHVIPDQANNIAGMLHVSYNRRSQGKEADKELAGRACQ